MKLRRFEMRWSELSRVAGAAMLLAASALSAHAEPVTYNLQLSTATQSNGVTNGALGMYVYGTFLVPTFAAGTVVNSAQLAVSIEAGGAMWRTGRDDEIMSGGISFEYAVLRNGGWVVFSSGVGTNGDGGWTSAIGIAHVADLNEHVIPDNIPQAPPSGYVSGSAWEEGGYVPVNVRMGLNASGALAHVPPPYYPSFYLFAAGIELEARFDVSSTVGALTVQADQATAEPTIYSVSSLAEGAELMPTDVRAQLPSYLPIATVPELPSQLLLLAGLGGLALRARRHTRAPR